MARPFYLDANPTWKDLTFSLVRALESGKPLANLTKETLTEMRIDQSFDVFYPITFHNVTRKSEGLVGDPTPSRKRRTSTRLEVGVLTYP